MEVAEPIILREYIDEMLDEQDALKERIKILESTLSMFADPDNWTHRNGFMIWLPDSDPIILAHRAIRRKEAYETNNG